MAWAVDQASLGTIGDSTTFGGTTVALTTNVTVASGSWIFACITWVDFATSTFSVSDNGPGLTWSIVQGKGPDLGGVWQGCAVAYAWAPTGMASGTVITATTASGNTSNRLIGAHSFTGGDASSFHTSTTVQGSATIQASWSSGTITTTEAGELLVSCASGGNGAASGPTGSTVESFEKAPGAGGNSIDGARLVAGAAGNYNCGGNWSFSDTWVAISVAMKEAAAVSAPGVNEPIKLPLFTGRPG